jgi:hypothetical protein
MYGATWQFNQAIRVRNGDLVAGFANPKYLFEVEPSLCLKAAIDQYTFLLTFSCSSSLLKSSGTAQFGTCDRTGWAPFHYYLPAACFQTICSFNQSSYTLCQLSVSGG